MFAIVASFAIKQAATTYGTLFQSVVSANCEDEGRGDEIGCQLANVLWTWMVFAVALSIFGFIIVLPLSWGNSPSHRAPFRLLVSILISVVYAVYVWSRLYPRNRLHDVSFSHTF